MDRAEFRAALADLDPDDETGLVGAIQQRVRALSSRHAEVQERIDDAEQSRRDLGSRLAAAEREIVEQVDAAVEADVDSVADVEALPADADVEFDPELVAEVRELREEARSNKRRTEAESADLRAELADNGEELALHREVLDGLRDGDLTAGEAHARLLEFLDGD